MPHTVIGIFDKREDALKAADAVRNAGLGEVDVNLMPAEDLGDEKLSPEELKRYHAMLAQLLAGNMDDGDPDFYAQALERGGTLVAVGAAEGESAKRVQSVMEQFRVVDTKNRATTRKEAAEGKA
ncbi:MAG TPA: hypothetical protein VGB55_03500, partial [Tepidisphaeraceae bacterium]